MGPKTTCAVPNQFFCRKPACALYIAAFNLADIQCGIQRRARIVQDINPQQAIFTSLRVYHDL